MAVDALNDRGVKKALGVPLEMTAVAPIIIGYPKGQATPRERKEPFILGWK